MALRTRQDNIILILSCLGTALVLYALHITHNLRAPHFDPSSYSSFSSSNKPIPNIVHYVYILSENTTDFSFRFSAVLSVCATLKYWQPDTIYLHTNAPPDSLARARSGEAGKWTQLIFSIPQLTILPAEPPHNTSRGIPIKLMEHKSDFVRVAAIRNYGGTYIDFDVHPLKDIAPLRSSGFQAIAGRQQGRMICSGVFMTQPHSRMIELWHELMDAWFDGSWSKHSNYALTILGQQLVAHPGTKDMLIVERDAFAPWSWTLSDKTPLLQVHRDQVSALDLVDENGHLPDYPISPSSPLEHWSDLNKLPRRPPWANDWAASYMLHAFSHEQDNFVNIPGFRGISPRYVLERRSNFARAVYPVARELYEMGLIEVDDPVKFPLPLPEREGEGG
ncbi:unnamed protein product [Zymoseptoria tritici ST99CH_1A5]|uniref:Glycosyl transferase n=1 Tax=Zymoseptoria tritici ST99CH_1A5 TaxID=1276529 RepID=A0A1Y6LIC2_ZYMTR|nr:unnamed protein product [Zymoseptoria tritici ST99CH_1A5]